MPALSDNELMLTVQAGDLDRLGVLFERYQVALYNFFVRLTADRTRSEDLVQDVFMRLLKYRHSFKPEGQFRVWMYQTARNVYRDDLRKNKRRAEEPMYDDRPLVDSDTMPLHRMQQQESIELLHTALQALPPDKREMLILSRFHELKHEEVAAIQGCSVGAVRVRLHRSIQSLKDVYLKLTREETA